MPAAAVGMPCYGRHPSTRMREVNSAHAKIRSIGERAIATLKAWKVLTKLHCCPQRATPLLAAILILHLIEEQRAVRVADVQFRAVGTTLSRPPHSLDVSKDA